MKLLDMLKIATQYLLPKHAVSRLVGYLAYPKDAKTPLPGVLVVHEWLGLNDYAKQRAEHQQRNNAEKLWLFECIVNGFLPARATRSRALNIDNTYGHYSMFWAVSQV